MVAIAVAGYAIVFALQARPVPFTPTAEVETTVNGNTAFALELYHRLETEPGNLFFSPFSISTALAMTYAGARGQTAAEIASALHFEVPEEKLQRWGRITLAVANSIWCQQHYKFTEAFLDLVHKQYRGEARQVDFVRAPGAATEQINRWVAHRTKGKITDAVSPGILTPDSRLVVCNAIYFKGKWLHQFKKRHTRPAPFHVSPDKTVMVQMMYQSADFKMAYDDDASLQILEMPYTGNDLSMVIFLPYMEFPSADSRVQGLSELERKLTPENLKAWLARLDEA